MRHAIFPGSFDPVTSGHIDVIHRCAKQFDNFTVLVANSTSKKYLFTLEERVGLIKEAVGNKEITVDSFSGLTVDYAKSHGANCIIRGLRAVADFEYELAMARMNKSLSDDIETMMIFSDPNLNFVSSSMIKEVAKLGGSLKDLVPENIIEALKNKFK